MDLISKYRLIGASIWLGLLVIIVPSWYNDPVNFQPDGIELQHNKSTLPVIEQPFRLPTQEVAPKTDLQQQREAVQLDMASVAALDESQEKQQALQQLTQTLAALNQPEEQKTTGKVSRDEKASDATPQSTANSTTADKKAPQWILRLSSFSDAKEANDLLGKLDLWGYEAKIKYFENSKVYSVRTGPYFSRAKADKDKAKLDKILRTNSVVVELP